MEETIIKGMNSSYPLVISAIKNTAVNGQYITPLNTPAIPTKLKLPSGIFIHGILFSNFENANPKQEPVNNDGAKFPPLPPPPMVIAAAIGLNKTIQMVNVINAQLSFNKENK